MIDARTEVQNLMFHPFNDGGDGFEFLLGVRGAVD